MSKLIRNTKKNLAKMERGQVLILVALAIVGIVAIIGLTLDVGVMFIEDARLRRAVDAAALAAALQYRVGVVDTQLTDAATEFLLVNGVTLDASHPVTVDTCTTPGSTLCDDPVQGFIWRKLVRVRATATVHLAFLPVIGINTVNISAEATGESASLDLVLVIDTSESMTVGYFPGDPNYDPNYPPQLHDPTVCNDDVKASAYYDTNDGMPGECHPFEEVKTAAVNFISNLFFPYDRVAVVEFNKTAKIMLDFDQNCTNPSGCTTQEIKNTITGVIKNLTVYDADGKVCPTGQPCLAYCTQTNIDSGMCDEAGNWIAPNAPGAVYFGQFGCGDGYQRGPGPDTANDPSQCPTTNIADGLWKAGNAFKVAPKPSSLWVVVLLTDGAADAGTLTTGEPTCPMSTWDRYRENPQAPLCRDSSSETRHCIPGATFALCYQNGNGLPAPDFRHGVSDEPDYDADDSAHDWADYVGVNLKAVIYSIGLGPYVHTNDDAGEKFLTYAAEYVGNGLYYNAGTPEELGKIFKAIGEKIATRLSQ